MRATGGGELFNVGGDKLAIIDKLLRREKKRLEIEAAPPERVKFSTIRTQRELEDKRKGYLQTRFYESKMGKANKYTILGDETRLRQELMLGFPVNSRDATTGRTILHDAVTARHSSMVRALCFEFRADVNIPTFLGLDTALHLGVVADCRQICVSLVLNGADSNAKNRHGFTPLFFVRSKRILKVLLRAGADPLILNKKGETALAFLKREDQLGDDNWEFGMMDLLVRAMDSMKIRRYKEERGQYYHDDGMSSMNSAAANSQLQLSVGAKANMSTGGHSDGSAEKKKTKVLAIESRNGGGGMRSVSANNLKKTSS